MKDEMVEQFLSTARSLAHQAKRGELAETDNKKKQQIIEQTSAKLSTVTIRNSELEKKCTALEQRCDRLTDQLRQAMREEVTA